MCLIGCKWRGRWRSTIQETIQRTLFWTGGRTWELKYSILSNLDYLKFWSLEINYIDLYNVSSDSNVNPGNSLLGLTYQCKTLQMDVILPSYTLSRLSVTNRWWICNLHWCSVSDKSLSGVKKKNQISLNVWSSTMQRVWLCCKERPNLRFWISASQKWALIPWAMVWSIWSHSCLKSCLQSQSPSVGIFC